MRKRFIFLEADRPLNAVDQLQERIEEIQRACRHNFRVGRTHDFPQPEGSLVNGVFIAEDQYGHLINMELQCQRCNLKKTSAIKDTCPRCLGKMEKGNLEPRERYHGAGGRARYASRLYSCKCCTFTVAVDEQDWSRSAT